MPRTLRGVKLRILHVNGTSEDIIFRRQPTLQEYQNFVGGPIEHLNVTHEGKKVDMLVNEEGKLKGLPVNHLATTYVTGRDIIVGDAVLFLEGHLE